MTRAAASTGRRDGARRGRVGWPAVALVAFAFYVTMLGATLPTPLYPAYAARFGFGELVSTVVFAVYAVGVTVGLLAFGHWSDQLGRRPLLLAGLTLSGLSAIAFLLPGWLGWLFVGRVISGLSAGIFTGTATATIVDLAPEGGGARANLVAAAVNMGGLGTGPLLAGVLAQYAPLPLRLAYLVDLGLVVLGAAAVLVVREPVARRGELRLRPRALVVPADIRRDFVRAAIAGFAGFAVLGLFTAVSPAFLGQALHHHSPALVGVLVLVFFVASVSGQTLSARVGTGRALPAGCVGLIVGIALVAASLPLASLALLVVGSVIAGFGQGMSFRAALGSVTSAAAPEMRGEVTSTFFVALYVAIAIPVIGEGALASAAGLVTAGVSFAVLVGVLAATVLVLLRTGRRTLAA